MTEQGIWFRDGRRVVAGSATRRLAPQIELDRRVRRDLDAENAFPNPDFAADIIRRRVLEALALGGSRFLVVPDGSGFRVRDYIRGVNHSARIADEARAQRQADALNARIASLS